MKRLLSMMLVCLLTAVYAQAQASKKEIKVKNAKELIDALGSNRTVIIKDGVTLNLSDVLGDMKLFRRIGYLWTDDYYPERETAQETKVSCERFDGRQFELVGVSNLTIRGGKNSRIVVNPRYAYVLSFYRCHNIRLERLTLGHTEEGYCEGGVINAVNSDNVSIANCDLYGCGTYGLETEGCNKVTMDRSIIRDCSYGIMQLASTHDCSFTDCDFVRCREFDLIGIGSSCSNIRFKRCRFAQNQGLLFNLGGPIRVESCEIHHPEQYKLGDVNSGTFGYGDQLTTFFRDNEPLQEREIGPAYEVSPMQKPSVKEQIDEIRERYGQVQKTLDYKRNAEIPLDETVVTSSYMAAGAGPIKDVTTYYYNGDFDEDEGRDLYKVYYIGRKFNAGSTDYYQELLLNEKGELVFFFEKSGENETRYYWADNQLIKEDVKGEVSTSEMTALRLAAGLVSAFDKLMNREI